MAKKILLSAQKSNIFKKDRVFQEINALSQNLQMKVYLVGGALRDLLSGRQKPGARNWDFIVMRDSLGFAEKLARILNGAYVVLDEESRTARVVLNREIPGYELDFAAPKAPALAEDLSRRDFTVNTFCFDLRDAAAADRIEVTDLYGGLADLRAKRIRMLKEKNFRDDPLRLLRGFSLAARLGFKIEKNTAAVLRKNSRRLRNVSPERIREELSKIFSAAQARPQVNEMALAGILDIIFPELAALKGLDQGKFHHLDAWEHSLETVSRLEKICRSLDKKIPKKYVSMTGEYLQAPVGGGRSLVWILKLAALLHDIGKLQTKIRGDDGRIHFYTHEKIGASTAREIGRRMKLSGREIKLLSDLVRYHLRPGQLVNRKPSKKAKFRFFRDTADNAVALLLLALADRAAMRGPAAKNKNFVFLEEELYKMICSFFKKKRNPRRQIPLINGYEVMALTGAGSGPGIGRILKSLEEAQALGKIRTKKEATVYAKKLNSQIAIAGNSDEG